MRRIFPASAYNLITMSGALMVIVGVFIFVFLYLITSLLKTNEPYVGLVLFMVVPVPIVIGLILIPFGMAYQFKLHKRGEVVTLPVLDLNVPSHRNATVLFVCGSIVFIFLSVFGSYNAYHFTDSAQFCGTLCHKVMQPEYVTYSNSPHARVACVECHVGEGASWYVKYKLAGLYQVYAVLANVYPRPISTPIHNLRPARETCERCHWPEKFSNAQQIVKRHFLADEKNSPWSLQLHLSIGGGTQQPGFESGVHWHIHPSNKVEFIANDEKRLKIPWVRWTDKKSGKQVIFQSTDEPLAQKAVDSLETRTMDCMDCHNRPSHIFKSPNESLNNALAAHRISSSLPYIKAKGIEVLVRDYNSSNSAHAGIKDSISTYYNEKYPEIAKNNAALIKDAVTEIQNIYDRNFFPEMKARWSEYPNNLSHLEFPGCYRCHDGKHVSGDGRVISHKCNGCHIIMAEGAKADSVATLSTVPLEFQHPVDIGDAWKENICSECHTGEAP